VTVDWLSTDRPIGSQMLYIGYVERNHPMIIAERTTMSQGMPITVTTVNGLDRVEINNKLHKLGDQLLKLKMEQQALIEMRNQIDRQNEMSEMGDLFDEMFGG
jgi:hypothetical protein